MAPYSAALVFGRAYALANSTWQVADPVRELCELAGGDHEVLVAAVDHLRRSPYPESEDDRRAVGLIRTALSRVLIGHGCDAGAPVAASV